MIVKNRLLNYKDAYIYQDTNYFKMSIDSLLLAKFVTINKRDKKILDIATGNAPIPMLLTYCTKAHIYGIEIQNEMYNLGRVSISENKMKDQIELINDDANNLSKYFKSDSFDVITCNPPYFNTGNKLFKNKNDIKSKARHEESLTLDDIFRLSKIFLKNNGRIAIVHRSERLIEILEIMKKYNIEPKKLRFVYSDINKNSHLVLIEGTKNGKLGLKILNPLYIYKDKNVYTDEVKNMFGDDTHDTK